MSLELYSYQSPYNSTPSSGAVAWFGNLNLDFERSFGVVELLINADINAANSGYPPVERLNYVLGQNGLPSFAQVLTDNAAAFNSIRTYIYNHFQTLSRYSNSTQI